MKKLLILLVTGITLLALTACSSTPGGQNTAESTPSPSASSQEQADADGGSRVLIAYFTQTGNTEAVANKIAGLTGGTLFQVETAEAYPEDYDALTDRAQQEQDENARPALSTHVNNMGSYDIVFVGYPIWWGTMPMAMSTFLEEYDFSGKTVIPFCTHGGSALGSSEQDMAALIPGADLRGGLAVRSGEADTSDSAVQSFIQELGFEF
ncbi:flavodoxin [Eubacterium sp. 1001713B170207_170306_E7]|uniref:flavodoxin n=1 Tax=Eubacterium sp. 1001713B170207_170306_E7 TaxID=2787097 RepID=UPI00189B5965|nr:flavodoxin [Eubacterium sp. 1001713B170207_170306_E7]